MSNFLRLLLIILPLSSFAIELSEFVPGFLMPKPRESIAFNDAVEVKPLVNVKRNSSATKTWYCNRMQNSVNNVFCMQKASDVMQTFNDNLSDQTRVVDTSNSTNTNIPSANQGAMQVQQTKVMMEKYQDNPTLPINTGKDVNMNINKQQIELNIKY